MGLVCLQLLAHSYACSSEPVRNAVMQEVQMAGLLELKTCPATKIGATNNK